MGMHGLALTMGNAALALKEKVINPDGPLYVRLVGRKSGLIDWLLTVLGINTTTVLEIYEDHVDYSYGSISGRVTETIPLVNVSNLICGYFKPVILFILGIIFCILTIAALFVVGLFAIVPLVLAVIFFVFYYLKKTTAIGVIPNSASTSAVAFKRSVIENQNITEEESKQIIAIVTKLISEANKK